jgi:predicted  nucleic acid-binding Zn-ribbon protein
MKMTNLEIYNSAKVLVDTFADNTKYLPIKVNFYLQKNKKTLIALAQDIDDARMSVIRNYGTLDETGEQYIIPAEKIADASRELDDLLTLEQDVEIYKIDINSFPEDIMLSMEQMEALMFMID